MRGSTVEKGKRKCFIHTQLRWKGFSLARNSPQSAMTGSQRNKIPLVFPVLSHVRHTKAGENWSRTNSQSQSNKDDAVQTQTSSICHLHGERLWPPGFLFWSAAPRSHLLASAYKKMGPNFWYNSHFLYGWIQRREFFFFTATWENMTYLHLQRKQAKHLTQQRARRHLWTANPHCCVSPTCDGKMIQWACQTASGDCGYWGVLAARSDR